MLRQVQKTSSAASFSRLGLASARSLQGSVSIVHMPTLLTSSARASATTVADSKKIQRPISPHVTIYKFPVPALTSITNRATGVALGAGISGAAVLSLVGAHDLPVYIDAFKSAAPVLVPLAKLTVAFPLVYHTLAGYRHLYWDATTKGLTLEEVNKSSYLLIGASAALTLGLAFVSI